MVGLLMGARPQLGFGLLIVLIYAPLVMVNLRIGVTIYVVLVFLEYLHFVSVGPTAAAILILIGWLGSMRDRIEWTRLVVTRRMIVVGVLFLSWLTLTALWATSSGDVFSDVWYWYVAALTSLVIMTVFSSRRSIEMVVVAFVIGAVLSVVIGLVMTDLSGGGGAMSDPSQLEEGRLVGGSGDPNYLAAGCVPAIMLAVGLFGVIRSPLKRWPLIAAIAILAIGLAGSGSRGGLVAAVVSLLAACIFFKHRRAQVLIILSVAASMLALWFTVTPGAWQRVSELNGGTGRTDLWHVAWRMAGDHPVTGVGLNNYRVKSRDYVRRPGNLKNVRLIAAEQPRLVHNLYLQLLAEAGVPGLVLFLCLAFGSMGAARRAAQGFDLKGETGLATLSRSVLVATIGILTAAFFLSNGTDSRQWILLGIGPALLALSRRQTAELD